MCGRQGGDGSAHWRRLACGFVGSGPRGRGYTGGKISACCLVFFQVNLVSQFPLGSSPPRSGTEPLGLVEWRFYRLDVLPVTHGTQNTNSNQWPRLIISSSTTCRLLMEEALFSLQWLSNTSTRTHQMIKQTKIKMWIYIIHFFLSPTRTHIHT